MEAKDGRCFSNQRVLPPYSTRRLYHPSFMSLYADPGLRYHRDIYTVHPMGPQEFFYTDPTMKCGARIATHLNEMRDFECFQLNTPPPIMSAHPAPPNRSDPFRTGLHLTRNLGCSTCEMGFNATPVNRMRMVIQLTQEEDQTITNLLKLKFGDGKLVQSQTEELCVDGFSSAPHTSSDLANKQTNRHFAHSEAGLETIRQHWSDAELDVANTLTHFGATSEDLAVKSAGCHSAVISNFSSCQKVTDLPSNDRVLSTSEGDALCGLLNLALAQTLNTQ